MCKITIILDLKTPKWIPIRVFVQITPMTLYNILFAVTIIVENTISHL